MKRFAVEVARTDNYIIEFDENVINEEWMAEYREYFTNLTTLEQHAENLAWNKAVNGDGFFEGYGNVCHNGKPPWHTDKQDKVEKAINIKSVSEEDFEFIVNEIVG